MGDTLLLCQGLETLSFRTVPYNPVLGVGQAGLGEGAKSKVKTL
jgi:hypothetical protein